MKKVDVNDYYIDQKKYDRELKEKRELEKETYEVLKVEFEQGFITKEEFLERSLAIYNNYDNCTKTKIKADTQSHYASNIIAGYKKDELNVPYDEHCLVIDQESSLCLSTQEVKNIEENIINYFATGNALIFEEYSEELQQLIFNFIDICCDPCELKDYLKDNGIKIISNSKRMLKKD